jgi:hypothetical protein
VSADFLGGSNDTLVDRIFRALTAVLALVLSLTFLAGGAALALYPNPKVGNVGNDIAADIFLTLGVTSFVGLLSWIFPKWAIVRLLADDMFRKLLMLAAMLAIAFFVVLIII